MLILVWLAALGVVVAPALLGGPDAGDAGVAAAASQAGRTPLLARMTGTRAEAEALGRGEIGAPVAAAPGADEPRARPERVVLFTGVRVFDGVSEGLSPASDVLVRDGVIERVSRTPIDASEVGGGVLVIDGLGRTLMPGLIDAHWHSMMAALPMLVLMTADEGYLHLSAGREAGRTLMRGFTTVRDAGGPAFSLKRAVDEGIVAGPRIYPSGAMVSQTGGHGDFRMRHELPRTPTTAPSRAEAVGAAAIADGADAVRRSVREQLMLGASQIKLMAGGGVSSLYDPLDATQYTEAEIRAAVEAADNWGTYVMVHAYTPKAVRQAIEAGVKCIEHGQLLDEETVELMAERGVWWSLQPFLADEDSSLQPPGKQREAQLAVSRGTERAIDLARKHGVRTAVGTDVLFSAKNTAGQGRQIAKFGRWFTPAQVLSMATSGNAELLAMSGERNPYPGRLGVVEEGALADLILVDGDPLADLSLIGDPERRFVVIMKGGVVYKNLLE